MDNILELNFSFVGHDGTRQAVTISEHGIKFSDNHKLATQELIFCARVADLMREFFHYKFGLLSKQQDAKEEAEKSGKEVKVPSGFMVH